MPRRRRHVLPEAEPALDRFKYEVADDLGLRDDIRNRGWGEMTTREVGKVGGNMVRRMIERAEKDMAGEEYAAEWGGAGAAPGTRDERADWAGYPELTRRALPGDRPDRAKRRQPDR